jgi:hypothetical protein
MVAIEFKRDSTEPYNAAEERVNDSFFESYLRITFVTGLVIAGTFLFQLIYILIGVSGSGKIKSGWFTYWFTGSNTNGEIRLKKVSSSRHL